MAKAAEKLIVSSLRYSDGTPVQCVIADEAISGSDSMGIAGSQCNPAFFQEYLGMRDEWVDMTEI